MKLDYLQFLELEMFTRFGAKLEASMQTAIKRGQLLREILKQDRFTPMPIEFQMAWLVAFNDGLFDDVEIEAISELLQRLDQYLAGTSPELDMERERWQQLMQGLFNAHKEPKT